MVIGKMFKFLVKLYCFFFGHRPLDGSKALTLTMPSGVSASVEICPRCDQLWGNVFSHKTAIDIQEMMAEKVNEAFKTLPLKFELPSEPSTPVSIECEFLLNEQEGELIKISVLHNSDMPFNSFEIITEAGKVIAWSLDDFTAEAVYTAAQSEKVMMQIGNLLNKVENPKEIHASACIYHILDYGVFSPLMKWRVYRSK